MVATHTPVTTSPHTVIVIDTPSLFNASNGVLDMLATALLSVASHDGDNQRGCDHESSKLHLFHDVFAFA